MGGLPGRRRAQRGSTPLNPTLTLFLGQKKNSFKRGIKGKMPDNAQNNESPVRTHYLATMDPVVSFLPVRYHKYQRDYFCYSVEYNTLAVSANNQADAFTVQNDSDFLVLSISHLATTDATGATELDYTPFLIRISDNASGAQWFDGLQHICNVSGRMADTGWGPFKLPYPRFVEGGAQVTVELSNMEATARRVWISLHGVKIFRNLRR